MPPALIYSLIAFFTCSGTFWLSSISVPCVSAEYVNDQMSDFVLNKRLNCQKIAILVKRSERDAPKFSDLRKYWTQHSSCTYRKNAAGVDIFTYSLFHLFALYSEMYKRLGERFDVTCSAKELVEISPKGDTKGEAVKYLCAETQTMRSYNCRYSLSFGISV